MYKAHGAGEKGEGNAHADGHIIINITFTIVLSSELFMKYLTGKRVSRKRTEHNICNSDDTGQT